LLWNRDRKEYNGRDLAFRSAEKKFFFARHKIIFRGIKLGA